MEGWNSSEGYEAMQRYQSAQAHAFQPFQISLQEHVGSVGVPNFFSAAFWNSCSSTTTIDEYVCSSFKEKGY